MPRSKQSERERATLEYLYKIKKFNQPAPSYEEIAAEIGVKSKSHVSKILKDLHRKGFIDYDEKTPRSLRLRETATLDYLRVAKLQQSLQLKRSCIYVNMAAAVGTNALQDTCEISIKGRITAGEMVYIPEGAMEIYDPVSSLSVTRAALPPRERVENLFALEVEGESMINAGINPGDYVILRRAEWAENGDMVAAMLLEDGSAVTLKYFQREGSTISLMPANPDYTDILIENPENLRILGKVILVVR